MSDALQAHLDTAAEALRGAREVRIVLWDGTRIEGVPTEVHEDDAGRKLPWAPAQEESQVGPPDRYIALGEVRVPVGAITSLELLD